MRLRTEIDPNAEEEIVIRTPQLDDRTERLIRLISDSLNCVNELALFYGNEECFVPIRSLLFFETQDGKVRAHTVSRMYSCDLRLCDLEKLLPRSFARASKSCLANTAEVSSISRGLSGVGTVKFKNTDKTVFLSRMYYKNFHDIIEETRL